MKEIIKTDKIDHIGMVVPNIEKALEHYQKVFNKKGSKPIISESQHVKISFIMPMDRIHYFVYIKMQ